MTGADPNFGDWIYRVRVETRGSGPPSPRSYLIVQSLNHAGSALDVRMSAPTQQTSGYEGQALPDN